MNNKTVLSARGQVVNFDLLKIKETLGNQVPTVTIKERENLIDGRLNRRAKSVFNKILEEQNVSATASVVEEDVPAIEKPELIQDVDPVIQKARKKPNEDQSIS